MELKLYDMKTLAATQLLFLIEFASFDAGSCIGSGILQPNSEKCLSAEKTGGTSTLGNSSGVGANGAVSYRGEENLWGNTPTYIQLPTENGSAETGIENSITDPPTELLLWQPPINGYVSRFVASKFFMPAVTSENDGVISGTVDTTSTDKDNWGTTRGMILLDGANVQYLSHGLVHSGEAGGLFSYCKSDGGESMFDAHQNAQSGKPVRFMSARFVISPASNTVDKTKVSAENVLLSDAAKAVAYVDDTADRLKIKDLGDNVDTAIQTLSKDLYSTVALVDAMREKNAYISSWADVKAIVDAGKAADFFSVGDKLVCNHSTYGLLVWEIVEINPNNIDITYTPSMTLMLHEPFLGPNIAFSSTGDPAWENSDIRKWLNSDLTAGQWYDPSLAELLPDGYNAIDGFLSGLDPDFLDIVGTSAVPVAVHSLDENDEPSTSLVFTYDRFYLPSVTEVFGGLNDDFDEGNILHKFYIENAEPGRDANANRIFRGKNWRLRSADDTENVLYVTGGGRQIGLSNNLGKIVPVDPSIYRIGTTFNGTDIRYLMPMCRIISGDEDVESGHES